MIGSNVNDLISKLPEYQETILDIVTNIFISLHIPQPTNISQIIAEINLQDIFTTII
jgi:hypothetical protein